MPIELNDLNLPEPEPARQPELPDVKGVNVLTPDQQHVILEMFARKWHEGDRHQLAMLFGGVMATGGVPLHMSEWLLGLLCDSLGDLEKHDRIRAVQDSYAKHKLGQPTAAWGQLQGYMSREEMDAISYALEGVSENPPSPGVEEGASSSTPKLRVYWGTELSATDFPKPPWIWDGIIPASAATVLCGEPKSGKSFLAANLAIACANGDYYHDRECLQTPVLYVNFEDFIGLTKWRMITMMGGRDVPEDVGVIPDPKLKFNDFAEEIEAIALERGCKLIILDPLLRSVYLKEENDNAEAERAINPLQQFAERTGVGVVIVHHTPKASGPGVKGVRGASSIFGAVQGGVFINRDKDDQGRFLDTGWLAAVGKYGPPVDHQIKFSEGSLWWELMGKGGASFELIHARKIKVLEFLTEQKAKGASLLELADAIYSDPAEAKRTVNSMQHAGDVRIENGRIWLSEYFNFRATPRG